MFFDWRTWGCIARPRAQLNNCVGERPERRLSKGEGLPRGLLKGEGVSPANVGQKPLDANASERMEGGVNGDPKSPPTSPNSKAKVPLSPNGTPKPNAKATKAAPLKYHTQQIWAAVLIVLASLALGYSTEASDLMGSDEYGKYTSNAIGGVFVNEDGQATLLAHALLLGTILLAPMVLTRTGSRVALVLTAAMPTAFVWLLPVAAKHEFANGLETLNSHDEADIVGVITTPQATGWMVALFSLPLVALLRIADVGGRGPQYSSRLRTTGVTTVILFYLWLLFGAWMRAPVRYSFPAHGETAEENMEFFLTVGRALPPGSEFSVSPPYATFTYPFRHPEHPVARYVDLAVFSLMMLSLAAHAATHRAARRLGQGGAVLCVFLPCFSALVTVLFGAFSYYRSAEEWGAGTLYNGLPIAVAEAVGLTGLAFLPLLHSPESDDIYSIGLVRKSYVNKLTPGRSLISPLVAVLTFATLPAVFRHFSFLADSDIHVDSRMDLSDPNILGAPCSAVTGAASLSSYVDSPFYAALLGLVFFFPLLDLSASSERKSQCSKIDAALSQSLCLALVMFVAFPLSYDAALHSSIAVLTFFLAAARATTQFCSGACVMSSIDNAQVVLCTLQVIASFFAILIELAPDSMPVLHFNGYVPCLDASPWMAESLALGLVTLTTSIHVFMARLEDFEKTLL